MDSASRVCYPHRRGLVDPTPQGPDGDPARVKLEGRTASDPPAGRSDGELKNLRNLAKLMNLVGFGFLRVLHTPHRVGLMDPPPFPIPGTRDKPQAHSRSPSPRPSHNPQAPRRGDRGGGGGREKREGGLEEGGERRGRFRWVHVEHPRDARINLACRSLGEDWGGITRTRG